MRTHHVATALACCALGLFVVSPLAMAQAKKPLSIIPGAHGFGMDTPAGSGRHLLDTSLEPGWDAALVGHWNFDDGKPGGALLGDAKLVRREKGHALRLSGKGGLSLAKAGGYVKPKGSFTIMAWVRMEAPVGMIAQNASKDGQHWRLGHFREGREKWMFRMKSGEGRSWHAVLNRDITDAKWRHVAGVYDGTTGRMRLYMNGDLAHNAWNKEVKDLSAAASTHLTIGTGMKGIIDDVMLFGAALSEKEISAIEANQHASYFGAQKTTVYKVTNLNTHGPGSLQAALDASGARVIVFEVAGNIDYTPFGGLTISRPYVTIAGQTAPSPGITLKGCEVRIGTHDVLMQHIRVRVGDLSKSDKITKNKAGWTQFSERDCMKVSGHHIVIDHCSFSWATDENVQSGADNLTFRHNIFSEGLHSAKHHKGGHSRGLLIMRSGQHGVGSSGVATIGNLFVHNKGRNPTVSSGSSLIVNNVVDDTNFALKTNAARVGMTVLFSAQANVIKRTRYPVVMYARDPKTRVYLAPDNRFNGKTFKSVAEIWKTSVLQPFGVIATPEQMVEAPPVTLPGLNIKPVAEVEEWVLANAGARPADRDPVDKRIVNDVKKGTGNIIASQKDVGGWPELAENRRKLTLPENPSGDDDRDGYTNLEEWLHGYAAEVEGRGP